MSSESTSKERTSSGWISIENFVSFLGEWAWVILLIEGSIFILWGIIGLIWVSGAGAVAQQAGAAGLFAVDLAFYAFWYTWYLIGGIITIVLAIIFVKPRFSDKWADRDYDYLLNDVIQIGSIRIPLMLIIGIIISIFLLIWGGLIILIPLLLLIFMGPKEYEWKAY